MFKKHVVLFTLVLVCVFAVFAVGCESTGENTKRGAIGGALVGSIVGGAIGYQTGHPLAGAAIGAGAGALTGAVIGDKIDTRNARNKEQIMTSGEKLGISDVIVLAKSGLSDDAIIDKIAKTGSVYNLSVEEIEALRKEGVSTRVINFMMSTVKK
jgi:uncharacterized membrane protein